MSIKVLIAPNSFKGSVSAEEAFHAFREGVYYFSNITDLNVETRKLLVCDGGTGFSEIIASKFHGSQRIEQEFLDPIFRLTKATYFRSGTLAIIESAQTIGHALLTRDELNPLKTSTYRLGQCIAHAIDHGAEKILLGCGDTATSDCGTGMLAALGVEFCDANGTVITRPVGGDLPCITHVDFTRSQYYRSNVEVEVEVACNLTSIASGRNSTALVYSRQKGASETESLELYSGFEQFTRLVGNQVNEPDMGLFPGSGAAGGVGFAISAFFQKSCLCYSFDVVFDAIGIDELLNWADIVITGEGLFDRNSVKGKAPVAVALRAKLYNVITIGVVGGIQSNITSRVLRSGFDIVEPFSAEEITLRNYCENFNDIARDATVRASMKALPLLEKRK